MMAKPTLEDRLTRLEALVRKLAAESTKNKDWRRTLGTFTGDEAMKRIDAEAHRAADRRKARRSRSKSRLTKP